MTREEFMAVVTNERIRPSAFSLDDGGQDECYILEGSSSNWNVYYSERGLVTQQRYFGSETDALQHLIVTLINDPSARLAI
jgi:SseB protein N-terminal domain